MNALWVSGIRPPTSTHEWQRRAHSILTGTFIRDGAGAATVAAEAGLAISPSSYWYVLRSDARFGFVVFVWSETDDAHWLSADGSMAPFDSGGLWHDKFPTTRPLDPAEKRKLVTEASIDLSDWRQTFDEYMTHNYVSVAAYIRGEKPKIGISALDYAATNDSAAWTWEARVAKAAVHRPLEIRHLFWSADDRSAFEQWLTDRVEIDDGDAVEILRRIEHISIDVPPVQLASDRALQYLMELQGDE